jgi:penicillin-binding protein 1C
VLIKGASRGAERTLVSPRTAFWITDILSDADARAFIFGRGGDLEFPFEVAVKTGTSQAYHDNWTIGYSRNVTVGVWVGNFDRTPLRDSSGVTGAGPVFHAVMLAAERHVGNFASTAPIVPKPSDLRDVAICALSGMRANPWCPTRTTEWIASDAEDLPCSWHHQSDQELLTIYPPQFRAWAAGGADGSRREPTVAAKVDRDPAAPFTLHTAAPLAIANPPAGAIYSIDPTLRSEFQALPLRAVTSVPTVITWSVDGQPLGAASSERTLAWPLRVGTHRIQARDTDGRRAEAEVVVR